MSEHEGPPLLAGTTAGPNAARVYDFLLGGTHHFEADRIAGRAAQEAMPTLSPALRANRSFLARAVRWCHEHGIRQYLDLGSGIPTVGNVHEVAQALDPAARVAYVDVEPVVVAHSAELLAGRPGTAVVQADLRDVGEVLDAPTLRGLIDLGRPVALMTVAVLHHLPDDPDLPGLLERYRAALRGGGVHVLTVPGSEYDPVGAGQILANYRASGTPITSFGRDEVLAMFGGLELAPPGLVDATRWHPDLRDDPHENVGFWAGVATVPGRA